MMRKKILCTSVALMIFSLSFQSCIGSFSLTNKVLTWNRQVSNKFVNELVFFAFWILPVYEVTAAADLLVINSIEFWSGNMPLEANNQVIATDQGNYYIAANDEGYQVKSPNGDTLNFYYDKNSQTWSFAKNDNEKTDFLQFIDEDHVKVRDGNGSFVDVELSEDGVNQYIHCHNKLLFASL